MTPLQYKSALNKLEISIVGAAPYWGISRRQAQRLAVSGPSKLIARIIKLLLEGKLKKEDLL